MVINIEEIKETLFKKKSIHLENNVINSNLEEIVIKIITYAHVGNIEYECIELQIKVIKGKIGRYRCFTLPMSDLDSVLEKIPKLAEPESNETLYNLSNHPMDELDPLFPFRNKSYSELMINDLRPDLGEVCRFRIDDFILVWNINKSLFIYAANDELNSELLEQGVELSHNINSDCVIYFNSCLFALSSDGDKLYYVSRPWSDLSERVYSRFNTQPKFFTYSYKLDYSNMDDVKPTRTSEGFIDFQTMVNDEILRQT